MNKRNSAWPASLFCAAFIISGCATNVAEQQALPADLLQIENIKVLSGTRSNATDLHIEKLQAAIRSEVAKRNRAGRQVDLQVIVTRAEFVSQGTRALSGMLAGSNKLNVDVNVLEANQQTVVGKFSVNGEYNPGGFGMFSDPVDSATADVAKAIAEKVLGPGG